MSTLSPEEVQARIVELTEWEQDGDTIRRSVVLDDFPAAIAAINRIAEQAEAADHHPELTNVYNRLTIVLTTHDAGGITDKDLALAAAIDGVL